MKQCMLSCLLPVVCLLGISSVPAAAQTPTGNLIVFDSLGLPDLQGICHPLLRQLCTVIEVVDTATGNLFDGTSGTIFLVQPVAGVTLDQLTNNLLGLVGPVLNILGIQVADRILRVEQDLSLPNSLTQSSLTAPPGLTDTSPVTYYGTTVWDGYVSQPAAQIIKLPTAQGHFGVTGSAGTVAVIDTGVDPDHPALQGVIQQGHDFTRNSAGASERGDINQMSMAVVEGLPAQVNNSTMADVDQKSQSSLSQSQYAAFGHGTMVSGIIHLVAPTAQILPLKAFGADGTGNLSDVLRSIYFATHNGANVLNMSFAFASSSQELENAVNYAADNGVVSVASVGNNGAQVVMYPAGLSNAMGIASTTDNDQLSSFSNYGQPPVWVGAPGEGIVTTYPFSTYAAGWGTSFSAPFVSGTVALMMDINRGLNQQSAAQAVSKAVYISPSLGYGRLDVNLALTSWCHASGTGPC